MKLEKFGEGAQKLGVLGIKVTQNGVLAAEQLWDGECRRNVYSASKSFTSCAVGFAVKEGLVALEEPLTEAFSEDLPETVSENLKKATVRDLLTMCLGQEEASLMGEQRPWYQEDDWVKMSLAIPFVYEPGTHFVYNNVGPYLAGVLVQRRSGCDLVSYLMPRLFKPLGIRRPMWECDPAGYTFGAGGLFLALSELHKFGIFCLQKGKWEGKQLLPASWIEECSKRQSDNPYSYLFWIGDKNSYRIDGKYCQWSIVFEDKNAVITIVAECRDGDALKELVFAELYPQL